MQDHDEELDDDTRPTKDHGDATRIYETDTPHQSQAAAKEDKETSTETEKLTVNPNFAIGSLIAQRFVLERLLGRGGMSIVYRARDLVKEQTGDPNPYVAIKILGTSLNSSPDAVIALQRETKKAQMLAHPHIVTMHDFQTDADLGLSFALMEELEGQSLNNLIVNSPGGLADQNKAIDIILSIADGLAYAHQRSIVHSDLKPSNIFVTDEGKVKILDFGIARAMPGSDTDQFDAGSLGALTPAYASSEMFDREPPDPSDDIYALGLIAYELLTGSHPYLEVLRESQPIKVAQQRGLKPNKVKKLDRRQWQTLASSLAFERSVRPSNAGVFLRQFRPRSNTSLYLGILLLVITSFLIYELTTTEVLTPETPFEELPSANQDAFRRAIQEGDTAYQFKDYNGALHYFSQAYELHPFNPEAVQGLDKIVQIVKPQEQGETREQLESKLQTVQTLLNHDVLAGRKDLRKLEDSLQKSLQR